MRILLSSLLVLMAGPALAQQVFNNDVIVAGSLCVGDDCTSSVNFGFDTLQLRDTSVRLRMVDTSTPGGSFPSTDWELTANDMFDGGANRFSITDIDTGRAVFTVEGSAPSNLLYLDRDGRVGIQTNTPALPLHVLDTNSPGIRLEQDGAGGFTPQVWDLVGNEAHFFLRDVTQGDLMPFKVAKGAPTDSLVVTADGVVGLGTANPVAPIDIQRSDGTARIRVAETNSTTAVRELFRMENNGGSYFSLENTHTGGIWYFTHEQNAPNRFIINNSFNPSRGMFLESGGNMRIGGVLTENSDKQSKMGIVPIDPAEVLAKLGQLELSEWSYRVDDTGARHLGPMAQDFYALFGLGASETGISTLDTSGVALAAIQALAAENADLRARIEALEAN